ncbi:hypothetical protein LTR37_014398 [Vermiconidia calcicola]|uniref:Uncharacterized protein n=1 Tax=Vermiconidia calcicola TaxID=1690605 RepID=A0ACC3MTP5_9PEZI|nr:hypothetical protein LTR37_014398 [Vermiconidia calcicola]
MPLTDPISDVSGRNSRASNVSGVMGASRSIRSRPAAMNDTLASAGVLSMLKTSTDSGDIGALSFNNTRLPTMPRAAHQRKDHHPRLSGSSNPLGMSSHHHYARSQTSRVSSSREWDTASNQRRGSLTSMQSMPPSIPPFHLGKGPFQMPPPPEGARDSRSFSMTSAPATQQLPRHRSAASLKSQGHEPLHPGHHRPGHQPPPMPENRPPYVYPTRLKRPGYRSPSPALSDTYAQGPPQPPMGARRMPMPRPPPQTYNSDYGADYNNDPRLLNVRPPPRAMSNSPVMGYGEPQQMQYPYRNPAAMRSAPGLMMPQQPAGPPHPGAQVHSHQPPPHMMHRQPYIGPQYPPRAGYPPYPPGQYQAHRGPPPPPNMAPLAHNMFHNAARMARQLPQRTDTPLTGPPSSDPPSSGTAPSSSNPPTPRDGTSIQVGVEAAFIDPALLDLPDSSSEPAFAHQYLRYAEGLEKDVEEVEIEAAHLSVPPTGFVQRVRAMLESKAAAEAAAMREGERERAHHELVIHEDVAELELEDEDIHELAANETPRFTIIEEFEAPVELPASPVRLAELGGSPIQHKRRITRDLVKAGLGPSSVDNTIDEDADESASIDLLVLHKPTKSRDSARDIKVVVETKTVTEDVPSTPSAAASKPKDDVHSEAASSPALGLSAVDYAVRFETTETTEETQSKDPFVLDADTITMQHQRSKERVSKSEPAQQTKAEQNRESEPESELPVSPILAGEDVSRCSAVSPLHTQTLGIDETLRMTSEPAQDDSATTEEPTVPGAFPDDTNTPATPRTTRTYSKSVQLQPTMSSTGTPSSNRFSLPPDLSTIGDTTVNSESNMITDVAVRFSLPQTTITVSKPQIIEIPPSSSPQREEPAPRFPKPAIHATDSKSKRSSVTFADEVAPLKINKNSEQHTKGHKAQEASFSKSKPIVRRPSAAQEAAENARVSRDSTTDLRFSGINGINNRFGSNHLPGLKEESVEEMSISDKRATDRHGGGQFPLPARIAAVKAMQERRLQESAEKAKARRAHRHPHRPTLAEIRDLPSLNFSRMDLIDKLNEALEKEVRSSKSMDIIRRREFSGIYCPSPQRPQSTEPLRERYMSFFNKPEDFSSFFAEAADSEDEDETEEVEAGAEQGVPTVEVEPGTEVAIVDTSPRSLSPEDWLNVATQVNRLSIPSVSGLSDRLSGILPNLRELQLDSILANFGDISADIRALGDGIRPETVLSNRTSAGFRTLAERAEEIVKNGTHDSTVPMSKLLGNNKDLPPLPESMSAGKVLAVNSTDGKQSYLSGSVSAPSDLRIDNVTRPESALTRDKTPMTADEVLALLPPENNPIARNQKRAMIISGGSSRPWNQDENYPWAGTKVDVDLTVPSQALIRDSTTGEILHQRSAKSLDLTSTGEPTTTKGIDIGSILERDPTATLTDEQLTGMSSHHHLRKQSKRSVIGSVTKKLGLGCRTDGNNTTRSIASPTVQSDISQSRNSQPHRPGERYPTSGLTPPAAFNLDEVRSFFSDDSSEKERNASFRKRLTNFNNKGKASKSVRLDHNRSHSRGHHSLDGAAEGNTAYDAGEMNVERNVGGASSSANTYDGVGMGKAEFRIKRFGEKIRHLMVRGGELIRSWSQRGPKGGRGGNERVRDDWLSDSLYSGV